MGEIFQYATNRDKAIAECIKVDSVIPFKAFIARNRDQFPECFELPSDEVLAVSIRQMCLHCKDIDPETKGRAVEWLVNRGFHLDLED